MSRAIGPHIGPFLKKKILEWLDEDREHRSAADLARRSGLKESHLSRLINQGKGGGWMAAEGIGRVLGYNSVGELEAAAREWYASSGGAPKSGARSKVEHPRLSERDEWPDVLEQAKVDRPELDDESFELAGQVHDSDVYPRPLTPKFVGNMAYMLFVDRRERSRRPP